MTASRSFKSGSDEQARKQDSDTSQEYNGAPEKDGVGVDSFSARQCIKRSPTGSDSTASGRFGGRRRRRGDSREQVYSRLDAWAGQRHE